MLSADPDLADGPHIAYTLLGRWKFTFACTHLVCETRLIHGRQEKRKKHGRDSRQSSLKIGRRAGKRSHGHHCREREEARRREYKNRSGGGRKADSTPEIREFRGGRVNSVNI